MHYVRVLTLLLLCALYQRECIGQADLRITITAKDQPLEQLFQQIEKQTGLTIYYPTAQPDARRLVSCIFRGASLSIVLDSLLSGKGLSWKRDGTAVFISKSETPRPDAARAISGVVLDGSGTPVAGASIQVIGRSAGTFTERDGTFQLQLPPPVMVSVSCVGFERKEVRLDGQQVARIELTAAFKGLDEKVVVGYGATSKRYGLGSVAKVSAATLASQPVSNVLQGLQGRSAGVLITTQNGLPGGNVSMVIRGRSTVSAGSTPLYVVDGVPVQNTPLNAGNADYEGAGGLTSPLATINPADIESVEILKDADATAIYGSRGANGVVLITTKKGKAGKTRATASLTLGYSRMASRVDYLSLPQYLMLRREAFANDSVTPTTANAPELMIWDTTKGTDWQDYIFGGSAPLLEAGVSVEGGSGSTTFLLSGSHRSEGTILPGNNSYRRSGAHFSASHGSADKRLAVQLMAAYYTDAIDVPRNTALSAVSALPPNFPVYDAEGLFNYAGTNINPVAVLRQRALTATDNLTASASLRYSVNRNLTFKLSLGHSGMHQRQVMTLPKSGQNPANNPVNTAFYSISDVSSTLAEPQLEYRSRFGPADVQVLVGGSWQQTDRTTLRTRGENFVNESLMHTISNAGVIVSSKETDDGYRYMSGFGRVSLRAWDKYLLNLSFRTDGSTRFGPDNRFGNFAAIGAGYLFSEEQWVRRALPWLSYGKLRSSYGVTGNDQIPNFQYLQSYSSGGNYNGVATLQPARLANADYSWERNKKFEVAAELGFLSNRLTLNVVRYHNLCDNQLVPFPTPAVSGFLSYQANIPAKVRNTGWEAEITVAPLRTERVSWSLGVNLTVPKTVLLSYPGLAGSSYASLYEIGKDLQITRGFQFTGVDAATGIATFADLSGDTVISGPKDYLTFGSGSPRYYGGLTSVLGMGNWELNVAVQFVSQYAPGLGYIPGGYDNTYTEALKRWQRPGDITAVPRATTTPGNPAYQALSYYTLSGQIMHRPASYVRLKTVAVSYALPQRLVRRAMLTSARLQLSAQNLLTFTRRDRRDPETINDGIPPLATLAAGIRLSF